MILFFDAISSQSYIGLFTNSGELRDSRACVLSWQESSKTISLIYDFLADAWVSIADIENIICVNGPGSFTGVRSVVLVVNTLAYMYPHIFLTPLWFFDLYEQYPIVKSSSKRDLFVKYKKNDIIHVISNGDFEAQWHQYIFWDVSPGRFVEEIHCVSEIEYTRIVDQISLKKYKNISPEYIKKPNIS